MNAVSLSVLQHFIEVLEYSKELLIEPIGKDFEDKWVDRRGITPEEVFFYFTRERWIKS